MPDPASKNTTLALNLGLLAAGMLSLAFASVPLYRLFCEVTGYGGTTRQGIASAHQPGTRRFTVRFNADTAPGLPWRFQPGQLELHAQAGAQTLTHYTAENLADTPLTGHATYNVIPFMAGKYFTKVECFCFKEQVLAPGESVYMPVLFYIDPAIESDPDLKGVKTITLSYTFFPVKSESELPIKP